MEDREASAWVEARDKLKENASTESNREEDGHREGENSNVQHEKKWRVRHKAQSEVAFTGVV